MSNRNNGRNRVQSEGKPLITNATSIREAALADFEQRRRNRLCIALALVAVAFGLVGGLFVWKFHNLSSSSSSHVPSTSPKGTSHITQFTNPVLDNLNNSKDIPEQCETTLLIIRHCEKMGPGVEDNAGNQHCSYLGFERSYFLPTLFGDSKTARWPFPSYLFAYSVQRKTHLNYREYETLDPLRRQLDLETKIVSDSSFAKEYLGLLQSGALCGKVTLAAWKHSHIVEMAQAIGCGPENGCPSDFSGEEFDAVWQLKYVYHPPPANEFDLFQKESLVTKKKTNETSSSTTTRTNGDSNTRRFLKKTKGGQWAVYGSMTQQNFDPLAFSYASGDYQGSRKGGSWRPPHVDEL